MTRLNARIDDQLAEKLQHLREVTSMSVTDIVKAALEAYYERFEAERRREARSVFSDVGFVGCASGDVSLSSRYKEELGRSLPGKA